MKAGRDWMKDDAPRLSAALAFFTMLSLSPLLLTATSVAGMFYEEEEAQKELIHQVRDLAGDEGAKVVESALANARFSQKKSFWSGTFGIGMLLFTSTAMFVQLQQALNKIWSAGHTDLEMGKFRHLLRIRGRSLALVLSIGFLLVVSLIGSAALSLLQNSLSMIWPRLNVLVTLGYNTLSLLGVGALFFMMFRHLPDKNVDTLAAWIGGISTAVLLRVGNWGIGLYLGNSAVGSAYGAAGSLVVFLLWIYYSMLVFFFGAEFTHVLSEDRLGFAPDPRSATPLRTCPTESDFDFQFSGKQGFAVIGFGDRVQGKP
ncbi:MAG: YihY/virulence factor BrkB family protein [Kiritimatiellae bacterium]|nr:YihY/virulence factor BrkB family protein [Kiritimatiellia bacterium]